MNLMVRKNDKELMLELLKFSKFLLPYKTEEIKNIEFYRRALKINGMAIAWVVYEVCDKEIVLGAITLPKNNKFFNCRWRNDREIVSRAIRLSTEFCS